jgi:hypothetical protein
MRPSRSLPLLLALALLPLAAGAKNKPAEKAAPAGPAPLELWIEAEDLARDGKPAEALAKLRLAIGNLERLDEKAVVVGPKGKSWGRDGALYKFRIAAGDVATQVDYRDAIPLYEAAVKVAPEKELRREAKAKLVAAQENVKAGVKRAPAFMGDDYGAVIEDAPPAEEPKVE